jgi:hypothetical protein
VCAVVAWHRAGANRCWLAHETVQQPVNQFRKNQKMGLKCLILLAICNFSLSGSNGQTALKLSGKVYCTVLHVGERPAAGCAMLLGRKWSLNGARWVSLALPDRESTRCQF